MGIDPTNILEGNAMRILGLLYTLIGARRLVTHTRARKIKRADNTRGREYRPSA